jgi:predicted flap endonuclease-1-like 5' DNA nuclease
MSNNQGMASCAIGCWVIAILGGVFAAILLGLLGGWTFVQAVFAAGVVAGAAGVVLSWLMCRPLPPIGTYAVAPKPEAAAETETVIKPEAAPAKVAAAPAKTVEDDKIDIKPSASLAGESELAARKGDWKYEGADPAAEEKPKAKATPKPKAKPAAKADRTPAEPGDGTKPATLDAARDGGPDNLKQIKGVGPKLEALLHSLGFYHFDQIASWGAEETAWVDQNLEGFKGRVTRDEWVSQAKTLAEGGTTEFSSKVKKGGVY